MGLSLSLALSPLNKLWAHKSLVAQTCSCCCVTNCSAIKCNCAIPASVEKVTRSHQLNTSEFKDILDILGSLSHTTDYGLHLLLAKKLMSNEAATSND